MKILYHHRTLADGAEGIHILEMIEAFRAEGHEVIVQAMAHGESRGSGHEGFLKRLKASLIVVETVQEYGKPAKD